jgi:hypothetical protein
MSTTIMTTSMTHELLQCARAIRYFGLRTPLHNQKLADEGLTLLDGMLLYVNEDWTASKNKTMSRLLRPVALKLIDAAPHNDIDTIKRLAVRHILEIITAAAPAAVADPQIIELYTYCCSS